MPKQQASVLRYCSSLQILLFYMYYTDQEAEKAILVGVALQSEGITYEQNISTNCHFWQRQREQKR